MKVESRIKFLQRGELMLDFGGKMY